MAKTYKGNVEITDGNYKQWEKELQGVEKIGGDLYINSQAKLDAPELKSVGGYLSIYSQAKLDNLKSVGGYLSIYSQAKLDAPELKSVGGDLSINSQAKLDNLKSVGGDLSIYSKISKKLVARLLKGNSKKQWYFSDQTPEELLKAKLKKVKYQISNVSFEKELFDDVRKDKLTAEEVFGIKNIEQRRVAYERMDKIKMKSLTDYKVLDVVKKDGQGKRMEVVTFSIKGYDNPFKYLHCIDASTDREYFVETKKSTCWEAKAASFGLDADKVEFKYEY